MFNIRGKREPPKVCTLAHHQAAQPIFQEDGDTYIRKDVFKQYTEKMDARCGWHEETIDEIKKKIDKNTTLLTGVLVSVLLLFAGLIIDILRGALT